MKTLGAKKIQSQQSKARILEAANRLFVTRGYHGTSVDAIAGEAKLTSGALYWHFKGKSDILFALIKIFDTEFLDKLLAVVGSTSGNALDKLHRIVSFSANFTEKNRYLMLLITVMSAELHVEQAEFEVEFKRLAFKYAQFIIHLLDEGKSEGIFARDLDTHNTAYAIFALIDGALLTMQRNREILNGPDFVRSLRRLLFLGLMSDQIPIRDDSYEATIQDQDEES